MSSRFLELLEGLPEDVQSALLEVAYERCCLVTDSTLVVKYVGCRVYLETDKFDFVMMTKKRIPFTETFDTPLEAWRVAYERLKQEAGKA